MKTKTIDVNELDYIEGKADPSMVRSIIQFGQETPVEVVEHDGTKIVIDGNKRCRAISEARDREEHDGKVIYFDTGYDSERSSIAVVLGNLCRGNSPIHEAQAINALIEEHGYTQKDISEFSTLSTSQISQRLALLKLPKEIQDGIESNDISFRKARMIASLPEDKMNALKAKYKSEGKILEKDIKQEKREQLHEDVDVSGIDVPSMDEDNESTIFTKCIGCGREVSVILSGDANVKGVICPECREGENDK